MSAMPKPNSVVVDVKESSVSFLSNSILEGETLSLTANLFTAILKTSVCK